MSSQRILVVDDEKSIREFLTILLQQEDYEVVTAGSVGEGKDRLAKDRPSLVMCDLKLPDGSGLEVLQHARDQNLATPFIIITAHTTPQHALEAMRAGAAEYLSKPFNVDDLKTILTKLLSQPVVDPGPFEASEFIGSSAPIRRILDMVPRIARPRPPFSSPERAAPARSFSPAPSTPHRRAPTDRS